MNTFEPTLSVVRPALNIDETVITGLRSHLEQSCSYNQNGIHRMFGRLEHMGARLVNKQEMTLLHRSIGGVAASTVLELEEALAGRFAGEPETRVAPVLPIDFHESPKNKNRKALRVGLSDELVEERRIARATIQEFYGIKKVPNGVWNNDELPGVELVRSDSGSTLHGLRILRRVLTTDRKVVPPVIKYGAPDIYTFVNQ